MKHNVFNVLAATADTSAIRNETHNGIEYMIVPVVALVEGVLHSANAQFAELALAEEFGRHPTGWNGRPLVMNHPKVNGEYVSANSVEILEGWAFGQIFNTTLDGDKLKTEAWIDMGRVAKMGGEVQETVDRLNAGEMVEISTGLMASVEQTHGYHANTKYHGIWRNVVPDHLAFLSAGTIGACSVAGGCGAPRINNQTEFHHIRALEWRMPEPSSSRASEHDCSCGCGGTCSGDGTVDESIVLNAEGKSHEQQIARYQETLARLATNSYPADMVSSDVHKLLRAALQKDTNNNIYWVNSFTQDHVIYEKWDSSKTYKRSYTIANDQVTLGNDETEVLMMTRLVDVGSDTVTANATGSGEGSSSEATTEERVQEQETQMATANTPAPEVVETTTAAPAATTETTTTQPAAPAVNAAPAAAAPAAAPAPALTVNEYIAQAPSEMQEVLAEGLKLHQAKRDKMVKEILANSTNTFSDADLKAMNMKTLESVHKLAANATPAPNYGGRVIPNATQQGENQNSVPRPLEAFPVKKAG